MVRFQFLRRAFASHRRWWRRNQGYNLVMLMVMVSVMNVLLAKALPMWSHVVQREKEKEMIFRALQYAEGARVYKLRYGIWPQKFKDLTEDKGKGRSIRRLWNNPLVAADPYGDEGEGWEALFEGMPDPCSIPENTGLDQPKPEGSPVERVGNILGVCSRVKPEILAREIPNWQFTALLIDQSVFGNNEGVFPMNSAEIGRPFPGTTNLPPQQGVTGLGPRADGPG